MNIFFDHQTFSLQDFGGISRYYTELINGINCTHNNQAYLPFLFSNNIHLRESGLTIRPFLPARNFYKKIQIIYRSNQAYTIAQLHRKTFDIFHATYYDPYFLPHLNEKPFVITFFDMIHEKLGKQFPGLGDGGLITKRKQLLANRASRIIAISESTKRDVVNLLDVDPAKIEVIYLGNSLIPKLNKETIRIIDQPYLLFVGNRGMYKNFKSLVIAIHPLLKQHNIKLLCAGGGAFSKIEEEFIHSLKVNSLVEQRAINDQILPFFYQNAIAFIFPSLHEGFGIPVLEAFSCSCPCIVSNTSSLPEVAGEAALYFDPAVSSSISDAVELLLNNSELRNVLIHKGNEQLAKFSWQRTVTETINLYQNIA